MLPQTKLNIIFLSLIQFLTLISGYIDNGYGYFYNEPSCVIKKMEAKEGQFPHQLSLMRNEKPVCEATLVQFPDSSYQFALTAAHCLETEREKEDPIYEFSLGAGSLSRQTPLQTVRLTGREVHENYTAKFVDDSDIAVLFFEEPFDLTVPTIKPIVLSNVKNHTGAIYQSDWDVFEENQTLRYAQVSTIPIETCRNRYYTNLTEEAVFCIGGEVVCPGELCVGDTGGPAITYQKDPRKRKYVPELVGVVIRSLNCGVVGYPGVYVRVSHHYDWIRQKVAKHSTSVQY